MNIYIMDSMYFDSVEKLLPAEFAKGYKILLFYEKGRKLPDIVFEYKIYWYKHQLRDQKCHQLYHFFNPFFILFKT